MGSRLRAMISPAVPTPLQSGESLWAEQAGRRELPAPGKGLQKQGKTSPRRLEHAPAASMFAC